MKKILTVALMLCIFTAMAVGTAAAKPSAAMTSIQMQNVKACGFDAKTSASEISGAAIVKSDSCWGCKTVIVAGAAQTACASACVGSASICQSQATCVQVCA
jgi:hypothetical protein